MKETYSIINYMAEILITEPRPNRDYRSSYSFNDPFAHEVVRDCFPDWGITPQTHPRAADICAGDGSWARLLVDNGWKPEDILCVDRCRSLGPLVEGVKWEYWDVDALRDRLLTARFHLEGPTEIPEGVAVHQGKFDLVIVLLGAERRAANEVANYLVRPGGKTFV